MCEVESVCPGLDWMFPLWKGRILRHHCSNLYWHLTRLHLVGIYWSTPILDLRKSQSIKGLVSPDTNDSVFNSFSKHACPLEDECWPYRPCGVPAHTEHLSAAAGGTTVKDWRTGALFWPVRKEHLVWPLEQGLSQLSWDLLVEKEGKALHLMEPSSAGIRSRGIEK